MPRLHELQETRAGRIAAMKAMLDKAAGEKRDLNDEESRSFESIKAEVTKIDEAIGRQRFIDQAERVADGVPIDGAARDSRTLARRFSVAKAITEHMNGKLSGVELEWQAEHRSGRPDALSVPTSCLLGESRAAPPQIVSDLPAGGYLVAGETGPLIDRLRPTLAIERMGCTILRDLSGFLSLPRIATSGVAYWVVEHQAVTRSGVGFQEVQLSPKTVGAEYEVSRRLMIQTNDAIEEILRRDLGYLLSQALDSAAINGTGGPQPVGILQDPSIPSANALSLGAAGGAPTIDTPADLIGLVEDANATGNTGFLTNSKVRRAMSKLKDSQQRVYSEAEIWRGERVVISNNVPSTFSEGASGNVLSAIIYGVWSDLILAYWSNIDILLNPYHSDVASKGGALLHAFLDCDVALRHGESFSYCKEVIAP